MSQSGFTPIQLFRTSTAAAVPTAGTLAAGELAINLTDEKLYFKNAAGVVKLLASNSGALGTVTSVDVSGGTTGLTTSGGPITSSGTITLAGTLGVANGGTGAISLSSGYLVKGNGTSAVSASVVYDTGTNVGIGTTSPGAKLSVAGSNVAEGSGGITRITSTTAAAVGAGGSLAFHGNAAQVGIGLGEISGRSEGGSSNDRGYLSFATNGTGGYLERMRIDSSGNLGIGTASPPATLSAVRGSDGSVMFLRRGGGTYNPGLYVNLSDTINNEIIFNTTYSSGNAPSYVWQNAGSEAMRLDAVGNLIINPINNSNIANTIKMGFSGYGIMGSLGTFNVSGVTGGLLFSTATSGTLSERMRIDASGNVGIGTSSPLTRLHVQSATSSTMSRLTSELTGSLYYSGYEVNRAGTAGGALMRSARNAAIGGVGWEWLTTADNAAELAGTYTSGMTLNNYGNLGIGTSSPGAKLAVAGGQINTVADEAYGIALNATTGNTRVIPYAATYSGSVLVSYSAGYAGYGPFSIDASRVQFFTNGNERMRLDGSGNVGIGTSSPQQRLQVNGSAAVTGDSAFSGATFTGITTRYIAGNNTAYLQSVDVSAGSVTGGKEISFDASQLLFRTISGSSFTERMRINSDGNVGIGTTPSAWGASRTAIDLGTNSYIGGVLQTNTTTNIYFDGADWRYKANGPAALAQIYENFFAWQTVPNGTGGAVATLTERMRLDGSGNVGIGTNSPTQRLDVVTSVSGNLASFRTTAGGGQGILLGVDTTNSLTQFKNNTGGGYGMAFYSGGGSSESMRINASGNLLVGTTTDYGGRLTLVPATNPTSASGANQISIGEAGSNTAYRLNVGYMLVSGSYYAGSIQAVAGSAGAPLVLNGDGGSVGIGTNAPSKKLSIGTTSSAPDNGMNILYEGTEVASFVAYSSSGEVRIGATNGIGTFYPTFYSNNAERARIDASGNLLVGTTSASTSSSSGVKVLPTEGGANNPQLSIVTSASTATTASLAIYSTGASALRFYVDNGGTIYATNTSISAISDQRFKENVRDLDTGLDTILALKPRRFDWKEGKGKNVKDDMGFIAQEVETVLPALVGGWKAGEGEPDDLKSVKAGDLIPVLVKAIQELTARVAQLEGN